MQSYTTTTLECILALGGKECGEVGGWERRVRRRGTPGRGGWRG